jgi:hypothetical protein
MSVIKTIATGAATAACLAAATLSVGAVPADARGDDRVIRTGNCSGRADWKLKVDTEDGGRLEIEGEVDSNRNGQKWRWLFRHNGSVTARGTATTVAPSGSFDVERRIVNLAGTDRVVFKATRNGQVCRGVVNY